MQRQMLREFEKDPFCVTQSVKREKRRQDLLDRGFLIERADGGLEPSINLRRTIYFLQEADSPERYVKVTRSSRSPQNVWVRLQKGNARRLQLLGELDDSFYKPILASIASHRVSESWYHAHADVLAWLRHKSFRNA